MIRQDRLLQNLSNLFETEEKNPAETFNYLSQASSEEVSQTHFKAQSQWFAAIATLESLLLSTPSDQADQDGLILSGPTGILSHPQLISEFKTAIFSPEALRNLLLSPFQLPSASETHLSLGGITELPLFPQDPIANEQFCLVFSNHLGLLMVLGEDQQGITRFNFSFDLHLLSQAWQLLRSRLVVTQHPQLQALDQLIGGIQLPDPDYRLVTQFSRLLLHHLPEIPVPSTFNHRTLETIETVQSQASQTDQSTSDVELLQALTHEIRTPLTTIRTMTQLLLKRGQLTPQMQKCLEVIDQECTEQIDRMELIFQATELETTSLHQKIIQLVPVSLEQVFKESIPRWQKQAQRRNIKLEVKLPSKLPQVVSDPSRLDQMLGGLMEKVTRSIPSGGEVKIEVTTAGHQLKLQVSSPSNYSNNPFKALGQLLMFQPDTGSLSLNLDVTKNLFQLLGGKLIVRQKPSKEGEILTVFLPLGNVNSSVKI